MKVKLIAHTPEPERVCAAAAMTSSRKEDTAEIYESLSDSERMEKARKLLRAVIRMGHQSVMEHASFTFSISGVSRAMTHELVRHRVASYTQQSQRYVKFEKGAFVTPRKINENEKAKQMFDSSLENLINTYDALVEMGIPFEDARFILPNAAYTNIVVTMNARELCHFFRLRTCERAQWEIREVATEMLGQCRKIAPALFSEVGPACYMDGKCPEGKLTCGRMEEIVRKFKEL
ncbi:MAG: FAD-dependent thymidylate synthase [Candidatus Micrarchaeota archaeon]|nr:FAD-dependent thymidylate synthase [Candidatus Micrarchaeota archaeon]